LVSGQSGKFDRKLFQKKFDQKRRTPVIKKYFQPPNPIRRDKPAQRFQHNPFEKRLDRKPFEKRFYRKPHNGVINRRNGFSTNFFKKV
jgi:hypothetical protein